MTFDVIVLGLGLGSGLRLGLGFEPARRVLETVEVTVLLVLRDFVLESQIPNA